MIRIFSQPEKLGYRWRSSKTFILITLTVALFTETFLQGFIVPILPYMFQTRLHVAETQAQKYTSAILAIHGFVSVCSGPLIGHFADRITNRKIPLLLSLITCILGTLMVAATSSLPILFFGRILQGVAASAVWIVGFATISDTVGQENSGTVMGLMMSFVNFGMISGPAAAGLLLEVSGYWVTWLTPIIILAIDLAARLVMIERPLENSDSSSEAEVEEAAKTRDSTQASEITGLLSSESEPESEYVYNTRGFWHVMLRDIRVVTVTLVVISVPAVGGCFEATLPLYVRETFGWGPGKVGFLFCCLFMPSLIITPFVGWIRDRIGIRLPAVISLTLQAVFLGLLGIAGSDHFSWASPHHAGAGIYVACVLALGILRPMISGMGPVELPVISKEYEENFPGIFGPAGGLSRVFSMVEVAASLGMMMGPIVSGFLKETFGYNYMNWTWGIIYVALAILVGCFLGPRTTTR